MKSSFNTNSTYVAFVTQPYFKYPSYIIRTKMQLIDTKLSTHYKRSDLKIVVILYEPDHCSEQRLAFRDFRIIWIILAARNEATGEPLPFIRLENYLFIALFMSMIMLLC